MLVAGVDFTTKEADPIGAQTADDAIASRIINRAWARQVGREQTVSDVAAEIIEIPCRLREAVYGGRNGVAKAPVTVVTTLSRKVWLIWPDVVLSGS